MKPELKQAVKVSSICISTYIINYFLRNILSVYTPGLIEDKIYTADYLALLSSTYMVVYAIGQMFNGVLGDHIKPKYMALIGMFLCSVGLCSFTFTNIYYLGILCFALLGFGCSTLRGPLVKTISENTLPQYARVACVFLSFASFSGPLIAGLFVAFFNWKTTFILSGIIAVGFGLLCFVILTIIERAGIVKPIENEEGTGRKPGIKLFSLFSVHNFVVYMLVGMVVEIMTISLSFWMPTFISQYLKIDPTTSAFIFSAISVARSCCPFISLFFFKLSKERDMLVLRVLFFASALLFAGVYFIPTNMPILVIIVFTLALMCTGTCSGTMWGIYIPSLAKTGMVSSANGILDGTGYFAASAFNVAVVPIMTRFGWSGVIVSWILIAIFGMVVVLIGKDNNKVEKNTQNA